MLTEDLPIRGPVAARNMKFLKYCNWLPVGAIPLLPFQNGSVAMPIARLVLISAAMTLLAGAAVAQTAPPTAEELQAHNNQISQSAADSVHIQNMQMQQNLQNDQARQSQLFANQPNAATGYVPPLPPPPKPVPPAPPPPAR